MNYPEKYIGRDGKKHAKCPHCGRDWLIGRRGGGMVFQAAIKHVKACAKKANKLGDEQMMPIKKEHRERKVCVPSVFYVEERFLSQSILEAKERWGMGNTVHVVDGGTVDGDFIFTEEKRVVVIFYKKGLGGEYKVAVNVFFN